MLKLNRAGIGFIQRHLGGKYVRSGIWCQGSCSVEPRMGGGEMR